MRALFRLELQVRNYFVPVAIKNEGYWSFCLIGWKLIDIDGDALHSSIGLPPALSVTTAKVGKLEIMVSKCF